MQPSTQQQFRMCGLPAVMPIAHVLSKWEIPLVVVGIDSRAAAFISHEITQQALNAWQLVCGLQFKFSPSNPSPNILITTGRIDAKGGTLAWSELPPNPNSNNTKLIQRYDISEDWASTSLLAVMTHELGHAIGLSHAPTNSKNLMAPFISDIITPQLGDIIEAQKRYGKPSSSPLPPNPPSPPLPPLPPKPTHRKIIIEGDFTFTEITP